MQVYICKGTCIDKYILMSILFRPLTIVPSLRKYGMLESSTISILDTCIIVTADEP